MFEKTTAGEWAVLGLSIIFGIMGGSNFGVVFILSLLYLYIIYWVVTKVYPNSEDWGIILWVIVIIFFAGIGLGVISGLTVSQNMSKIDQTINQATFYVDSANSRLAFISSIDIETVWVGNIKANASAAKSDLNEASKILNTIVVSDLNSQDQADLQALKVMLNAGVELCDLMQGPLSNYIENFQTYTQTKDPIIAANSLNGMKTSLSNMKSSLGHMSDEMNTVNENDLSPEVRADFISLKSIIQSGQESLSKTSNTLANVCTITCNWQPGYVVGEDCQCHPACGANYCSGDANCCGGQCYLHCPSGYSRGNDCKCYSN